MNNFDPSSYDYNRVYNKPKINWRKFIIYLCVFFILLFVLNRFLVFLKVSTACKLLYLNLFMVVIFLFNLKNVVVLFIKIYQNIAPISIRMKCRFEPSCSNYMLMAIEKYGVIKGLKKGIKRIKRCNINDGGYDYP